jgi:hypothetical protein
MELYVLFIRPHCSVAEGTLADALPVALQQFWPNLIKLFRPNLRISVRWSVCPYQAFPAFVKCLKIRPGVRHD